MPAAADHPAGWCRRFTNDWSGDRAALAAILGPGPAARAVLAPAGVLVVTGQQPAVGGGPLYTVIKAVQAVAEAEALAAAGVPAAALFWCASDDHDVGEADHADLIARDGTVHRVRGDLGPGRAALRHRPALPWWPAFVAACQRILGPGPGSAWVTDHGPRPGEGLGAWQVRLLEALVPGLQAVEAVALRPLWRAALVRAVTAWPAAALAERRAALLAEGRDPLGPLLAPPLFEDRPDGRSALAEADAAGLAMTDPDRLSPGAGLRPVLQQAALPAAAVVLGPGERAYHAAIAPLYPALGVPAPVIIPRWSRTLVPGWCERACAAHGLAVDAVLDGARSAEQPVTGLLAGLDAVLDRLAADHPARVRQLGRLRRERDRLARSLSREAEARPRLGSLRSWLRPREQPHERVMSLLQAVWCWGPGVVQALGGDRTPGHRCIRL